MIRKVAILLVALALVAYADVPIQTRKITQKRDRYSVEVSYPQLTLADFAAQKRLNGMLQADVEGMVREFVSEYQASEPEMPKETPDWSLQSDFTVVSQTPSLLSLRQNGYDFRGGAHGNPVLAAYLLDLKRGRRLHFKDLFRPGYEDVLRDYTRKELKANKDLNSDNDWIDRGTEDITVGFPTRKGLLVVFGPYQVAPYSSGMPEVLVPWSVLKPVVDPQGPLGKFMASGS